MSKKKRKLSEIRRRSLLPIIELSSPRNRFSIGDIEYQIRMREELVERMRPTGESGESLAVRCYKNEITILKRKLLEAK